MMYRTQVTLDPELHVRGRRKAQALGVSFSEYMRRLLEKDLTDSRADVSPELVFDLGRSNDSDVTRNKDAMIGEALDASRESSEG